MKALMIMPRGWLAYNPRTVPGRVTATGNYTYADNMWECTNSGVACVVYAYYKPGIPILGATHTATFSPNLTSYLNAAAAAVVPIPFGSAKIYIYIKGSRP